VDWRYLDLADFLLIAEAVLDIPAEDLSRAGGWIWPTRRCMRRQPSSVGWSSIRTWPARPRCSHHG
jgi:hypothetical protein